MKHHRFCQGREARARFGAEGEFASAGEAETISNPAATKHRSELTLTLLITRCNSLAAGKVALLDQVTPEFETVMMRLAG